jgi:hypothetical protein
VRDLNRQLREWEFDKAVAKAIVWRGVEQGFVTLYCTECPSPELLSVFGKPVTSRQATSRKTQRPNCVPPIVARSPRVDHRYGKQVIDAIAPRKPPWQSRVCSQEEMAASSCVSSLLVLLPAASSQCSFRCASLSLLGLRTVCGADGSLPVGRLELRHLESAYRASHRTIPTSRPSTRSRRQWCTTATRIVCGSSDSRHLTSFVELWRGIASGGRS